MPAVTPDNLTTVDTVKTYIGLEGTTTWDSLIALLIPWVSGLITTSCNRTHFLYNNAGAVITNWVSGQGEPELVCPQWPVYAPVLTGTTTSGSPVVTGLSSTTGLFVNQSVSCPNFPTNGSLVSIASVNNATQVTLNQNATASGSTTLAFDLAVWQNDQGYWNSMPGAYPQTNQLVGGGDYALMRDMPDGSSESGILYRIADVWDDNFLRNWRMLAPTVVPGRGNYQVQACYGFTSVPADLEMACAMAIAKARSRRRFGGPVQSEGDDGYNYSLGQIKSDIQLGLLDGDVAAILSKYRVAPMGLMA